MQAVPSTSSSETAAATDITCMAWGPQLKLALGVFAADRGQAASMPASVSTFAYSAVPCYPRDASIEGRIYASLAHAQYA